MYVYIPISPTGKNKSYTVVVLLETFKATLWIRIKLETRVHIKWEQDPFYFSLKKLSLSYLSSVNSCFLTAYLQWL